MKNNIIMVVGGGEWQLPIIKKCQSKGYKVLCTNLYADTPGSLSSDYFELADVRDLKLNLSIARKYSVIGVITDQSDIAVTTVAHINEKLNLNGISQTVAQRFTDKLTMRNLALESGVLCPKFVAVNSLVELKKASDIVGFPFVLKPRTSQSSRGVLIVNNIEEIESAYKRSVQFSDGLSLIVEEYIGGEEYTIEGYKTFGDHYNLTYSVKKHYENNPSVASRLQYIDNLDVRERELLYTQNDRLVKALGLSFGITHAEYKYFNGSFYLIEIAARGGGTHISSKVVPFVSGVDINSLLIEDSLNSNQSTELVRKQGHQFCELIFLHFQPGIVLERTPIPTIQSIKGVLDFGYSFLIGDELGEVDNDRSRHAHLIIGASTVSELREIETLVRGLVVICYE